MRAPWKVVKDGSWRTIVDATGKAIVWLGHYVRGHDVYYGVRIRTEDAKLIAEAGTVLYESGCTPRQLMDQCGLLMDAVSEARAWADCEYVTRAADNLPFEVWHTRERSLSDAILNCQKMHATLDEVWEEPELTANRARISKLSKALVEVLKHTSDRRIKNICTTALEYGHETNPNRN